MISRLSLRWVDVDLTQFLRSIMLRIMESSDAISSLAALAQESRLAIFRLLVRRGPEGYTPTQLGERLGGGPGPLSFHLKELLRGRPPRTFGATVGACTTARTSRT